MKPERAFIAERTLARHCPELLRQGPTRADLLPLLERMGGRLERKLADAFAPMLFSQQGAKPPLLHCARPRETDAGALMQSIAPLAANSLFAVGAGAAPLLVSIEAEPVLRMVDRAFGGKGEAPAPMPKTFPMAAELMIARLEKLLAEQVGLAIAALGPAGAGRTAGAPAITPLRRDGSLAMLAPFAASLPLIAMTIEVDDGSVLPWLVTIALPEPTLFALFGCAAPGSDAPARRQRRRPMASPTATPFADMPVEVVATLVDMQVPFAPIAGLAPGQILPVAVARAVPLSVADVAIAHGTVGALDERVALQLTRAFDDSRSPAS